MTKKNRDRLIALAKLLEALAQRIRKYVTAKTPRRGPNARSTKSATAPTSQVGLEDAIAQIKGTFEGGVQ